MFDDLVLITGASGYVGYRVVVNALELGYRVRAVVRSQSKADTILAAPSIKRLAPGDKLTFIIVSDIASDGAYDEAVQEVRYIVHVASPLSQETDDYERDIINPAVKGTIGMLKSAAKTATVKRIVITSSIIAVVPFQPLFQGDSDTVFTADNRLPNLQGPFTHHHQAYAASKIAALNATDKYMATETPPFDVINIMPFLIIGRDELVTSSTSITQGGTNYIAFAQVLGDGGDATYPAGPIHVDDVAKAHILCLNPKTGGNRNFGMMSGKDGGHRGNAWDEALAVVKRRFPEAVKDGRLPNNGRRDSTFPMYDTSETERALGMKFQSYEDMVVDVAQHYLELLEKEQKEKSNVEI